MTFSCIIFRARPNGQDGIEIRQAVAEILKIGRPKHKKGSDDLAKNKQN